ncbi:MAG: hypothetical protein WBX25_21050, partial [Rhodomicrobium sp.]
MKHMNYTTGTAFCSRKTVADELGIAEKTVDNCAYDLRRWEHMDWQRLAVPELHPGRRFLHYTLPIVRYSEEDIAAAIKALCIANGEKVPAITGSQTARSNGHSFEKVPVLTGSKSTRPDGQLPIDTTRPNGQFSDRSARPGGQFSQKSARPGGCSNKYNIEEEEYSAVDHAFAAYNNAAREHGFSVCHKLTDARRKRIQKRLDDIGGLDQFTLALSAIPSDNFLMGKVAPRKSGERPFKLELESLLSTESGLADVLA